MVTHKKPPSTTFQRIAGTLCLTGMLALTALGTSVTNAASLRHETAHRAALDSSTTPSLPLTGFPTAAVLKMHSIGHQFTVAPVAASAPKAAVPAPVVAPAPAATPQVTTPVTTPVTAPPPPQPVTTASDPLGLIPQFEALGASPGVATEFVCIAWAESRDTPTIVNQSSQSSGLFQFMPSTWAAIGMAGLPENASVATQVAGAWRLYQESGFGPWTGDPCVG